MTGFEEMKRAAAQAAVRLVDPSAVLGLGGGSTVATFVDVLGESGIRPPLVVAASQQTAEHLASIGIKTASLAEAGGSLPLYIDGADEIDPFGRLIKGAGGAHASEKHLATASRRFVCIADESKVVTHLGESKPVPLELLEGYLESVTARVEKMGGHVQLREDQRSDAGNMLVDVSGLNLGDPARVECDLDAIPGVVECGIFALWRADLALIGMSSGRVREIDFRAAGRVH